MVENNEKDKPHNDKQKKVIVRDLLKENFMVKSSQSKKVDIPSWAERFPDMCYFQVIKKGVLQPNISMKEGCMSFIIGRSDDVDAKLDHTLLSRAHLMLVYGKGERSSISVSKFWAVDLFTQNKSKLNKQLMNPGQFYPLEFGYTIHLAEGSFILVLENSASKNYEEEEEAETIETDISCPITSDPKKFSYTIDFDEKPQVTVNPKVDKNYEDLIKEYFDRKGLEPDYEVDTISAGPKTTYHAKLSLTVYDSEGNELTAEGSGVKRNLAISECAKNACSIIEKLDDLYGHNAETEIERRERELIENDYYDDEDDSFFDRSGEVERKRLERMKRMGKAAQTPETSETLVAKLDLIVKDMDDVKGKIDKLKKENCKANDEEDEIDKYINELQIKIDEKLIDELEQKLNELAADRDKLEQRLGFSFLQTKKPSLTSNDLVKTESERVVYDKNKYGLLKDESFSSNNSKVLPVPSFHETQQINEEKELTEVNTNKEKATNRSGNKSSNTKDITTSPGNKRKHQNNTDLNIKRKEQKKHAIKKNPEISKKYCSQEDEYDWIPPNDQTGDGVTPLNKKYNY